jgi:hypothetical protein
MMLLSMIVRSQTDSLSDVFALNVGGQLMMSTRGTLTRLNDSLLGVMFSGPWDQQLSRDSTGHVFLDLNPKLFGHLLDQLRLSRHTSQPIVLEPPADRTLFAEFEKMLSKLKIKNAIKPPPIVQVNVGGHLITAHWDHVAHLFHSPSSPLFLDQNPKAFRTLFKWVDRVSPGLSYSRSCATLE